MRNYLYINHETAAGTPVTSPTLGTDATYIRLYADNSFSGQADPQIHTIPYGGGFATDVDAVSDCYLAKGQIRTLLYPSQAAYLINLAMTVNNGTLPFTTSEPLGDLGSASLYNCTQIGSSFDVEQFSYAKILKLVVACSRQDPRAMVTLDWVGGASFPNAMDSTSAPTAPTLPTDAQLPLGPYTFRNSAGTLACRASGSAFRANYDSFTLTVENYLDYPIFEKSHPSKILFTGRKTTLDANVFLTLTPDDRAAYMALTQLTAAVGFGNGAHSVTFTMNGNNHLGKVSRNLPLNKVFMQPLQIVNKWDSTAGSDVTVAVT